MRMAVAVTHFIIHVVKCKGTPLCFAKHTHGNPGLLCAQHTSHIGHHDKTKAVERWPYQMTGFAGTCQRALNHGSVPGLPGVA